MTLPLGQSSQTVYHLQTAPGGDEVVDHHLSHPQFLGQTEDPRKRLVILPREGECKQRLHPPAGQRSGERPDGANGELAGVAVLRAVLSPAGGKRGRA